jgi:hypothetical protein
MQQFNSTEVGNQRPYSTVVLYNQIQRETQELASLKAKIHIANAEVMEDIFWMSEMKSTIAALKKMDCTEGKSSRERFRMESEMVLTSEISLVNRNQEIKMLEVKIEEIQDKLDTFNATTEI